MSAIRYCTWENQHESNAKTVTKNVTEQSIVATKKVIFAPTVTRKVILPKTVEPNDMATVETVTKVIGFAHGVEEMAKRCKTVSRKTKPG